MNKTSKLISILSEMVKNAQSPKYWEGCEMGSKFYVRSFYWRYARKIEDLFTEKIDSIVDHEEEK